MKKTARRKITAVMMVAAMAAMMLTGCAAEETSETTDASSDTDAQGAEVTESPEEPVDIYVFIAASLQNTMEEIKANYEKDHSNVNILYSADSSGTLQTQIEEGARCDIFFSAATKQMDALEEGGYVLDGTVKNLLENKIVLIKPTGAETEVTGFDNITSAANIALAGEDVPVGQYARSLFTNIGILDQVMEMEINEGANVTAVLASVAEGSNEVGVVYATDAASMADQVEVIAEAAQDQVEPAIYPVGMIKDDQADQKQTEAAEEFMKYLTEDPAAMDLFVQAGFTEYTE